jgi:hypothetical protein
MDLIQQNLETISSIHLHNMTVDELVRADSQVESRFHFSQGIWWREVKPFFYHPAAPMTQIVPHTAAPAAWRALGGYYYMVPPGAPSNGLIVANEIPNPASYQLESLKKKRNQIRRALAFFRIARVDELNHLLGDGFRIYLDWEKRTKNVRLKRSNPVVFNRWISRTFHHPHKLLLGAYARDHLAAFLIAEAIEGVANISKIFSDSCFNELTPASALIYAYVKICGQNREIRKACHGLRGLIDSLERYKSVLGFEHVSYPAFIHLRPVIRPLVRCLMPMEYRRLTGQYATESPTP